MQGNKIKLLLVKIEIHLAFSNPSSVEYSRRRANFPSSSCWRLLSVLGLLSCFRSRVENALDSWIKRSYKCFHIFESLPHFWQLWVEHAIKAISGLPNGSTVTFNALLSLLWYFRFWAGFAFSTFRPIDSQTHFTQRSCQSNLFRFFN